MVGTTNVLDLVKLASLNVFDDESHMAFGTGVTSETKSDITLSNEVERTPLTSKIQNSNDYEFVGRLPLGAQSGSNISEIGVFNSASGVRMSLRKILSDVATMNDDNELFIKAKVTSTVVNI